jgi:hypothetical protein
MFVESQVSSTALISILVGWHASAVCLPKGDVIFAQLAWPLNNVTFYIRNN